MAVYKTRNGEVLEYLVRKFLNSFREDQTTLKDLYIFDFNMLKPTMDAIHKSFEDVMIDGMNNFIQMNNGNNNQINEIFNNSNIPDPVD